MPEELARLLAAGERAAFHGRPIATIEPLGRAIDLAATQGRVVERAAAGWLLGVGLAAAGQYGSALDRLEQVVEGARGEPAHSLVRALAAATAASVHRALGRHDAARAWDLRGLAIATDPGAEEGVFDCRLGLAADAIGLGDGPLAQAELGRAEAILGEHPQWWRQRVRARWVGAEVALLARAPGRAVELVQPAVAAAEAAGAPRHVAKSLLFLGVSLLEDGRATQAGDALRRCAVLAEGLGAVPLVWPARAVLGALLATTEPEESARSLDAARGAVALIAAELPEELLASWLAREDVAALLER